jgi:hypothetical protein
MSRYIQVKFYIYAPRLVTDLSIAEYIALEHQPLTEREYDGVEKGQRKADTRFEELRCQQWKRHIAPGHYRSESSLAIAGFSGLLCHSVGSFEAAPEPGLHRF